MHAAVMTEGSMNSLCLKVEVMPVETWCVGIVGGVQGMLLSDGG